MYIHNEKESKVKQIILLYADSTHMQVPAPGWNSAPHIWLPKKQTVEAENVW